MQYDFNLPANGAQFIDVKGSFFRYKNGTGKIRVRNSTGGYIDLIPGQGVNGLHYSSISITDLSGAANSGYLLAGDYEFLDSTITGAISLLGTSPVSLAAPVSITGGVALIGTSPVSLAAPVSITGGVALIGTSVVSGTVAVSTIAYSSGSVNVQSVSTPLQIIAPATNINGVIINRINFAGGPPSPTIFALIAKSSVPQAYLDGEVLDTCAFNAYHSTYINSSAIKVSAGKGIYFTSNVSETAVVKNILYTIL